MSGSDAAFEAMLAEALAPPDRAPDRHFVNRVDRAISEQERYRRQCARLKARLFGEIAGIAALGGSVAMLSRIPDVRDALVDMPSLAWPALASLLLFWLVVTRLQRLPT